MTYVQVQLLQVKMQVKEPHIDFNPSFPQCWELVHSAFMEIISSAKELPRVQFSFIIKSLNQILPSLLNYTMQSAIFVLLWQVECVLFTDLKSCYLHSVHPNESLVTDITSKAEEIFHKNTVGPKK